MLETYPTCPTTYPRIALRVGVHYLSSFPYRKDRWTGLGRLSGRTRTGPGTRLELELGRGAS